MEINYIDDDMNKGILIDWKAVKKEFNKLDIPNYVFNPFSLPLQQHTYYWLLSERSVGKTTNLLLLGMVLYKMYGIKIQYIRQTEDMTAKQVMDELFSVILQYGYIEKLTDGEYNSAFYYGHKWTYCHINEDGIIDKKAPEHFFYALSLDKCMYYKSAYNAPTGDLIIMDEAIGKRYNDDFYWFSDILKTIIRDRHSPLIFIVSNTINKYSKWFDEMKIQKDVLKLKEGGTRKVVTEKGTTIYLTWVHKVNRAKALINSLFFGFDNPKLNSITGDGWLIEPFQHIPPKDICSYEVLNNMLYIYYAGSLIRMQLVMMERIGLAVYAQRAEKVKADAIIYTKEDYTDLMVSDALKPADLHRVRYRYGLGDNLDMLLFSKLWKSNRWFYATSDVSDMISSYCDNRSL